jgi:ADP-heptose:LPS heptosyltransferase
VEHQLTVMRWLGLPLPGEPASSLYVGEDARRRIQARLKQAGLTEYLLIHPTATLATKQWKPENFGQLGDLLFRRYGLPVIYTAAAHELPVLEKIRRETEGPHHFWADLPLMDLFALVEKCSLFIGNDSGPTHAAAALKRPVVVVWGSSNFTAWHPWKTPYEAVRSDLPCIPCPGYECAVYGEPKCILDISVERVADACDRLLSRLRQ